MVFPSGLEELESELESILIAIDGGLGSGGAEAGRHDHPGRGQAVPAELTSVQCLLNLPAAGPPPFIAARGKPVVADRWTSPPGIVAGKQDH